MVSHSSGTERCSAVHAEAEKAGLKGQSEKHRISLLERQPLLEHAFLRAHRDAPIAHHWDATLTTRQTLPLYSLRGTLLPLMSCVCVKRRGARVLEQKRMPKLTQGRRGGMQLAAGENIKSNGALAGKWSSDIDGPRACHFVQNPAGF